MQYGDGCGESLVYFDDGGVVVLQALGVTTAAGDIWKVVITGQLLSAWKNGTQVGTNEDVTARGFTSGSPGIAGSFAANDTFASWRGGDGDGTAAGGPSPGVGALTLAGTGTVIAKAILMPSEP